MPLRPPVVVRHRTERRSCDPRLQTLPQDHPVPGRARNRPAQPSRRHPRRSALVRPLRLAAMIVQPPGEPIGVIALGNGQILLRGAVVIDCWRAVSSAVRNAQRRDGLNPPARLITLERLLATEAQLATAAGRLDVREGTFLPPFRRTSR